MGNKRFLADFSTRGIQTVLLRNCTSKAEAKRKLLGFYKGTLTKKEAEDVEFISAETTTTFPTAAKIVEDES